MLFVRAVKRGVINRLWRKPISNRLYLPASAVLDLFDCIELPYQQELIMENALLRHWRARGHHGYRAEIVRLFTKELSRRFGPAGMLQDVYEEAFSEPSPIFSLGSPLAGAVANSQGFRTRHSRRVGRADYKRARARSCGRDTEVGEDRGKLVHQVPYHSPGSGMALIRAAN